MKNIFLYIFLIVSLGELSSELIEVPILHTICKPAIIITLIMYYGLAQRASRQPLSITVLMALLFSWIGDVLLMQTGEQFFIFGLGAFLTAHVIYIFVYRQHRQIDNTNALKGLQLVRFAFPIVFAGIGLVTILYSRLADLRIPVTVYAIVITVMTLNALFRYGRTNTSSFAMVFGGAILFMISDSLLAINKFLEPFAFSGVWIMLTYIGAQFLIVQGLIAHRDN